MSEHDPGFEQPVGEELPAGVHVPEEPSLTDDVKALIGDGKIYLEAELQFQKSRAALAVDRGKSGVIYGLAAAAVAHLALIALVVGVLIALIPAIGPWGATALVVGVLLIGAAILGLAAKRRFARLSAAFAEQYRVGPMTDMLERNLREDRLLRDAARALVDADIANLRASMAQRSIPARIGDRIGEGASEVLDEAVEVADDNKGVIAALIGAVILWFARHPIMEALGVEPEHEAPDNR